MNDTELQQEMKRVFPVEQWVEYEGRLAKKKLDPLTSKEQQRLDLLRYEAGCTYFPKGLCGGSTKVERAYLADS